MIIREYSRGALQAMQETVENFPSELSITATVEVKEGLRNALYNFVETVIIDMTNKEALDEALDRSIDRWKQ